MIVRTGQNILDATLAAFGSLEPILTTLIKDNPSLTITGKLPAGQDLVVNNVGVGDDEVKNFVTLQSIIFSNNQGTGNTPQVDGDMNNDFSNDFD